MNASRNIGQSTTFSFGALNVAGSRFTKRSHGTRAIALSLCFGRTFDRPPARAGNPDTDDFDRAAAFTHGFGLYVRESVADKTDQQGEREAVRDPQQPAASAPLRFIQHFKCAALLRAEGHCHCLPVRLSRSGGSFQFGRASLPMMRQHVHPTRPERGQQYTTSPCLNIQHASWRHRKVTTGGAIGFQFSAREACD